MRLEFRVNSGAWKISAVLTATPGWITRNHRGGRDSGCSRSPRPSPQAEVPWTNTGTSAPSAKSQLRQLIQRQARAPKRIERQQHRGGIRTAAAQAAAGGNMFNHMQIGAQLRCPVCAAAHGRPARPDPARGGTSAMPVARSMSPSRRAAPARSDRTDRSAGTASAARDSRPRRRPMTCRNRFSLAGAGHQVSGRGHSRHVLTTSVRRSAWRVTVSRRGSHCWPHQRIVGAVDLPAVLLQVRQPLLLVDRFLRWKARDRWRRAPSNAGCPAAARTPAWPPAASLAAASVKRDALCWW